MTRTRSILAANPSFQNEIEASFWSNLQLGVERYGWSLLLHSARRIEPEDNRIVLPARLAQLPRFFAELPYGEYAQLPEWLSYETFQLIVAWEHRRWQITRVDNSVAGGLLKLAWHVDRVFECVRPAVCLTSNKIDHGCYLFYLAAQHYGSAYRFIERSPFSSFLIEKQGMFAESEVHEIMAEAAPAVTKERVRIGKAAVKELKRDAEGFREQARLRADDLAWLRKLARPLILFPLDNTLWTGWAQHNHPQGDADYPSDFRDVRETIVKVAELVGRHGGTVLLKKHPSDVEVYFDSLDDMPKNVVTIENGLNELLDLCDGCVTFLTKTAFPAICRGVPTAVVSTNTIASCGLGFAFSNKDELEKAIASICGLRERRIHHTAEELDRLHAFLGWLAGEFYIDMDDPVNHAKRNILSLAYELVTLDEFTEPLEPAQLAVDEWARIRETMGRMSLGVWENVYA